METKKHKSIRNKRYYNKNRKNILEQKRIKRLCYSFKENRPKSLLIDNLGEIDQFSERITSNDDFDRALWLDKLEQRHLDREFIEQKKFNKDLLIYLIVGLLGVIFLFLIGIFGRYRF